MQHNPLLLQSSPLEPCTRKPRQRKRDKPCRPDANSDSDSELLLAHFLLVARRLLDHVVLLRPDHHERDAQVVRAAVVRVERAGVVEPEYVALERIGSGFQRGDIKVRIGEVGE